MAKVSAKTAIKTLNRKEPFTQTELDSYSIKEQNLIRGIQLKDKTDKETAKQTYIEYLNKGEKATKQLSSSVRRYFKSKYPKHGKVEHGVDEFERKQNKTKIKQENKQQVRKFILNKDNQYKNETTYNRVKNASVKYPNASVGELRHGVNSKWSQEYRVRRGLSRNYK